MNRTPIQPSQGGPEERLGLRQSYSVSAMRATAVSVHGHE
jgi:hypothetical protein